MAAAPLPVGLNTRLSTLASMAPVSRQICAVSATSGLLVSRCSRWEGMVVAGMTSEKSCGEGPRAVGGWAGWLGWWASRWERAAGEAAPAAAAPAAAHLDADLEVSDGEGGDGGGALAVRLLADLRAGPGAAAAASAG